MSIWLIAQILFNTITTLIIFILWAKLKRPPQEDPRLSRGLQLLQSKIAIIENLSDKTEEQFKNINDLIEKKSEKLQKFIIKSEEQIGRLESSMKKSNEIANIFQDKIPHDEVIKRKQSMQMITAARMAHGGASVDEIVDKVKLPKAQVELITKVNKEHLVFDNQNLPAWVKNMEKVDFAGDQKSQDEVQVQADIESLSEGWVQGSAHEVFDGDALIGREEFDRVKQMGADFKELCTNYEQRQRELDFEIENNLTQRMINGAEKASHVVARNVGEASHVIARNMSDVGQVIASNVGDVSSKVAKNVSANVQQVSAKVRERADGVGQQVYSHVSEVTKRVTDNANMVGNKIVEKTSLVLEPSERRNETEKTKIKKVKFPTIDSDKDIF